MWRTSGVFYLSNSGRHQAPPVLYSDMPWYKVDTVGCSRKRALHTLETKQYRPCKHTTPVSAIEGLPTFFSQIKTGNSLSRTIAGPNIRSAFNQNPRLHCTVNLFLSEDNQNALFGFLSPSYAPLQTAPRITDGAAIVVHQHFCALGKAHASAHNGSWSVGFIAYLYAYLSLTFSHYSVSQSTSKCAQQSPNI